MSMALVQKELIRQRDEAYSKLRMALRKYEKLRVENARLIARNGDYQKRIDEYTSGELLRALFSRLSKLLSK